MSTVFINTGTNSGGVGPSTVTLQAFFNILDAGQIGQVVNYQLLNPDSPCNAQAIDLAMGANTISATNCPAIASAAGVFILPQIGRASCRERV